MSIALTAKVVTVSEKNYRPKTVQPGNCEQTTVIQELSVQGWAILPFIILTKQYYLSAWYSEELSSNQVIEVSETGQTINELGFQQIQHFEKHTRSYTTDRQ